MHTINALNRWAMQESMRSVLFDIMKAELPLKMFDVFDHIVTVTAALVNVQPPIVPLKCR